MVRAGVPKTVAMSISGHRTASVFDRYDIASDKDKRQALSDAQQYLTLDRAARAALNSESEEGPDAEPLPATRRTKRRTKRKRG